MYDPPEFVEQFARSFGDFLLPLIDEELFPVKNLTTSSFSASSSSVNSEESSDEVLFD